MSESELRHLKERNWGISHDGTRIARLLAHIDELWSRTAVASARTMTQEFYAVIAKA